MSNRWMLWLVPVVLAAGGNVHAAPGDHLWSDGWDVNGSEIASNLGGDVFTAGVIFGTADLGGGPLIDDHAVFVAKFGTAGTHEWSAAYAPTVNAIVTAVAAEPSGGVYVAGDLPKGGTIDFGGGPLSGLWIVKFDANGAHVWSDDYGDGLIHGMDASSTELAITGRNTWVVDFGGGPLGTPGDGQVLVAKLAADGSHLFSQLYGDAATQKGEEIGLLGTGDVIVAAAVRGSIDFGGGALSADANDDLAVTRLSAAGGHVWSQLHTGTFGQFGSLFSLGLDVDDAGNVALAGEFTGDVDFGGGTLSATGVDIFLLELNAAGGHSWSASFGGSGVEGAHDVAYSTAGDLLVAGSTTGSLDLGGGTLATFGGRDGFIAAIGGGGSHEWSLGVGSPGYDSRLGVERAPQGAAYLDLSGGADCELGGGPLAGSYFLGKYEGDGGGGTTTAPALTAVAEPGIVAAPNPFRASTRLRFATRTASAYEIDVVDASGRLVRRLSGAAGGTEGEATWDGRASNGAPVSPGVYFARLRTADATATRRLVRLR